MKKENSRAKKTRHEKEKKFKKDLLSCNPMCAAASKRMCPLSKIS